MKNILLKCISVARSFLDRAEASLDETPRQKLEDTITPRPLQDEEPSKAASPATEDILVPFSTGNASGVQSTYKDRKPMNALLDEWIMASGIDEKQAKSMLRKHAGVHRIDYMTIGQVSEACTWLQEQIRRDDVSKRQERLEKEKGRLI